MSDDSFTWRALFLESAFTRTYVRPPSGVATSPVRKSPDILPFNSSNNSVFVSCLCPAPRRETADGFEEHWGINYLASVLLTLLLLPYLVQAGSSRVVMVSSMMQELGSIDLDDPNLTRPGSFWSVKAYSNSKLAQVHAPSHWWTSQKWQKKE